MRRSESHAAAFDGLFREKRESAVALPCTEEEEASRKRVFRDRDGLRQIGDATHGHSASIRSGFVGTASDVP